MICGTLGRRRDDGPFLPEPLARALAFLDGDLSALPAGRHALEGEILYAVVAEAETGPFDDGEWESHRRYVDVQCLLEGEEWIGWAPDEGLPPRRDALDEEDCLYYDAPSSPTWIRLLPGRYAVFFPDDLHCPLRTASTPSPIRKIVVKIALSLFRGED